MSTREDRRISASFCREEIAAASAVTSALLRGGDVRVLLRSADFARFANSVQRLEARAAGISPLPRKQTQEERVLAALRAQAEPVSSKELSRLTGVKNQYVTEVLCYARKDGLAEMLGGRGKGARWRVKIASVTPITRRASGGTVRRLPLKAQGGR